jgi:hypothetical protein
MSYIKSNLYGFLFEHKHPIAIFFLSVLVFSFWLIIFWPATLSVDSINQLEQIKNNSLNNAHPYLSTLILGILVNSLGGVSSYAFLQVLITSLLLSLFTALFLKKDVSITLIYFTVIVFWTSPAIGIYNVTIWKDVLFAQLIIFMAYLYLRLFDGACSKRIVYMLLVISLATALLRHNGMVYLILTPLLILFLGKSNGRQFISQITVLVFVFFLFQGPIASLAKVNMDNPVSVGIHYRLQLIGAIINSNDANISNSEKDYYSTILPIELFQSDYRCSTIDGLVKSNRQQIQNYFNNKSAQNVFIKESNFLILKNMPIVIADRGCLLSYQVGLGVKNWYDPYYSGVVQNDLGFTARESQVRSSFEKYLAWTAHIPQRLVFWNHLLSLILYIVAVIYGIWRNNKAIIGFCLLIIVNVPVLAAIGVSNDFRYLYMLTLGIFFLPGIIMAYNNSHIRKKNEIKI